MSYRHATDRVETVVVSECPKGCDVGFVFESEGKEDAVDSLVEKVREMFDTCNECGAEMGVIRKSEPTEVLE